MICWLCYSCGSSLNGDNQSNFTARFYIRSTLCQARSELGCCYHDWCVWFPRRKQELEDLEWILKEKAVMLFTVHCLFLPKFVWKKILHEHLTPILYYSVSLPLSLLAWTNRETGLKQKTINFMKLFWVSFCYWVISHPRSETFSYEKEKRKPMESEENLLECWIVMSLKRERDFLLWKAIFCRPEYCEIVVHRTHSSSKYDAAQSPFNVLVLLPWMGKLTRTGC